MMYPSQALLQVGPSVRPEAAPWVLGPCADKRPAAVNARPAPLQADTGTLPHPGRLPSPADVAEPSAMRTDGRREPGAGIFGRALAAIFGEISGSRRREKADAAQIDPHTLRDIGAERGHVVTRGRRGD